MKKLIIDWSPVIYGNLFGSVALIKRDPYYKKRVKIFEKDGVKKYDLDTFKDVVVYKIFDELSKLRNQFNLDKNDEIIIATDTPDGGYWRKDVWEGYKAKRGKTRDESDVDWDKAYELFDEINDVIIKNTSFKMVSVPRTEGDDIVFVLSEYLSQNPNNQVIIHSSDHDFFQCIKDNVQFWRTTRSCGLENSSFCCITPQEKHEIIQEHVIAGDPGDGFGHIKQYSQFSDKFLEVYPQYKNREKDFYKKRFQVDTKFFEKYGVPAYKHPRFGYKTFKKSKKDIESLLNENDIYRWNYELNQKLALPENIPDNLKQQIITAYKEAPSELNPKELMKYFQKYNLLELYGLLPLF